MGRILAIDFGTKRCGVAETDDLQIAASPLTTVAFTEIIPFLQEYLNKYKVEIIVVGDPRRLDDTETHSSKPANEFANRLKRLFPEVRIDREDEAMTSKMAMQAMVSGGMKKKDRQQKGNLDKVSAAIILQNYLRRRELNP